MSFSRNKIGLHSFISDGEESWGHIRPCCITERMITSLSWMMPTDNHCRPNRSLAFSLLRIEYEYSTGGMFVCITRSLVDSNRRTSYTLFTDCFRLIFILYQLVSYRFSLNQNQIKIIFDLIIHKRKNCPMKTNIDETAAREISLSKRKRFRNKNLCVTKLSLAELDWFFRLNKTLFYHIRATCQN